MLPNPDILITHLPVPSHKGIIISKLVNQQFTLTEIKDILHRVDFDMGFECISKNARLKLILQSETDTMWVLKWQNNNNNHIALIMGSEL